MSIERSWKRVYPYAPMASHVVGYMGAITAEDEARYKDLGYDTSLGGEDVGRAGVELSYEEALHGKWGEVTYEVDAANRIVREISRSEPVNGMDVQLSIDLDLQQYTERLLQTQLRAMRRQCAKNPEITKPDGVTRGPLDPSLAVGTCVNYKAPAGSTTVMNYQTGQIMAMASYPTFDNRWFSAGVDSAKFEEIFPTTGPDGGKPDPDRAPLANRAIQGQYNLGSTFKVVHGVRGAGHRAAQPRARRTTTRARTRCSRSPSRQVRQRGHPLRVPQLVVRRVQRPVQVRRHQRDAVARGVERRVLLQARRGLLQHAGHAAAGPGAACSASGADTGDRPAVRVRRPGADERGRSAS